LCLLAMPMGSVTYPPVLPQLILGSCVLEMTSVLVSVGIDSLQDAAVTSLLDKGTSPTQQLVRIDLALTGICKRMKLLNRAWSRTATG